MATTGAPSEKQNKTAAHRRERRECAEVLRTRSADESLLLPDRKSLTFVWVWEKDGKMRIDVTSKSMRK